MAGYTRINRTRKKSCGWVDVFEAIEGQDHEDGNGPRSQIKAERVLQLPAQAKAVATEKKPEKKRLFLEDVRNLIPWM